MNMRNVKIVECNPCGAEVDMTHVAVEGDKCQVVERDGIPLAVVDTTDPDAAAYVVCTRCCVNAMRDRMARPAVRA